MASYSSQPQSAGVPVGYRPPVPEPGPRPAPVSTAEQPAPPPADHAARAVMHPDRHDPDWRYYHGAMGG